MKLKLNRLPVLGLLILSGCGNNMTVVDYNDQLVDVTDECMDSTQNTWDMFQGNDANYSSLLDSLNDSIQVCQSSLSKVSKIGSYEEDSSMKDAVENLLTSYVAYLQKFSETSVYRNIAEITEEDELSYKSLNDELKVLESDLNDQLMLLQSTQTEFANKYGLKLVSIN